MDEAIGQPSAASTDGELVRSTLAGDALAFELLVLRYQPLVQSYARHLMGQDPIAEDLIQESFIRAFTGLHGLTDPERFGAWMKSIVWRQCRDWVRRRRATAVRVDEQLALAASEVAVAHDPADDLWLARLEQTIEEMSDGSRIALAMYYVLDEPQLRIAADARAVINVGSVGQPRDNDPRACWALYDDHSRTWEFRRVAYDAAEAARRIREAGLSEKLADRLLDGR